MKVTLPAVKKEIMKCILIRPEEKQRWIALAEKSAPTLLGSIYRRVKGGNDRNDKYILEAFKHEPQLLDRLKNKVGNIKRKALEIREEELRPGEIEDIEKQIQNL